MSGIADTIYRNVPIFVQNTLVSAYGYYWKWTRLSGQYKTECENLRQRDFWTHEQWIVYSTEQLRKLLSHAWHHVPHYHQTWQKYGITLAQLQGLTLDELATLPPLEKSVARDAPESLLVDGRPPKSHFNIHTSGSSGTPVKTYWIPSERRYAMAFRNRACNYAGIDYTAPRATFGGRIIVPAAQNKGPFHRYNRAERQVYLSAFHLNPNHIPAYLAAIKKHEVQWITGYAYSIYELAQMTLDLGLKAPKLVAALTTSEKVTDHMRTAIERAFSTTVYEEYSTVENLFFVTKCEHGRKHVSPDAGIIEVVDEDFNPVPPGKEGEVLGTGFIRQSQPMIRYRIGDRAIVSPETACPCGRQTPIIQEVIGRLEDTIYGPDGRRIVRFHGIFTDQPHVKEGQLVQDSLYDIRVRVVPKLGFSEADEQDIVHRVHQRLTDQVWVQIEKVEHIERSSRGKFRAVVSNLSEEDLRKVKEG